MANDISLFWEWLGVLTGLVALFALVILRVKWQDPPEPQTWIDRILEADDSSTFSSSPISSEHPER
ncbi:MAG: hypothetical protein IGR76_10660 [Synechococcales cyanobacterium T60_A2020_003]|nr:hypothetical protein [Synechococcales cyanobacterium T60_A2020_003]